VIDLALAGCPGVVDVLDLAHGQSVFVELDLVEDTREVPDIVTFEVTEVQIAAVADRSTCNSGLCLQHTVDVHTRRTVPGNGNMVEAVVQDARIRQDLIEAAAVADREPQFAAVKAAGLNCPSRVRAADRMRGLDPCRINSLLCTRLDPEINAESGCRDVKITACRYIDTAAGRTAGPSRKHHAVADHCQSVRDTGLRTVVRAKDVIGCRSVSFARIPCRHIGRRCRADIGREGCRHRTVRRNSVCRVSGTDEITAARAGHRINVIAAVGCDRERLARSVINSHGT
jgi:hypothetical protein